MSIDQDKYDEMIAKMTPEELAVTRYMVDRGGRVTEAEVVQHCKDKQINFIHPDMLRTQYDIVDIHHNPSSGSEWEIKPHLRGTILKALENAGA